ncbi:MAG TPA: family 10 glycosylhydrolase [Mucilaginibacter sp.]|nr:family 10 glycosylhydrolase [Mucilaginibacter sp.]
MRINRQVTLLILSLILCIKAKAQPKQNIDSATAAKEAKADSLPPKREFRGVWIATVGNIDWPSKPGLSTEQQKQELIDRLDAHQRQGINAVMLQIRPAADAFYAKSREPWSKWLTGKQGKAPDPFYDPLAFAITEAHKRGMELHAWFNPYRATNDNKFSQLSPSHITRIKPEWFFTYGGIKLFNPGIPEVRDYIVRVFLDVVDNYDIDGVHLDDYFYPYQIDGQHIRDAETFKQYGQGYDDIRDWRRHNVDTLIEMLSDSIQAHKPRVKFGISPFGIWANKYQNPEGSDTHGGSSYYELFADSRKWVKEGWVDYINPQLYWPIDDRSAAFNTLLDWWSDNTYGRHLYIGMAAYRINERRVNKFKDPAQMPDQIKYLRKNPRVEGSVYFSSNSLNNNPLGFADSLRENYYKYPALPPPMLWLDSIPPNAPVNFTAVPTPKGIQLRWGTPPLADDKEPVYGYVIYRFEGTEKIDLNDPRHILHIRYNNSTYFVDETAKRGKSYSYVVTALDRLKNESDPTPTVAASIKQMAK